MTDPGFQGLEVWREAHTVVLEVHRLSERFPRREMFALTSQTRRAAMSIPANIAEGYGRRKPLDKARCYTIAQGSVEELRSYLILAKDLGYASEAPELRERLGRIGRRLHRLIESMEARA